MRCDVYLLHLRGTWSSSLVSDLSIDGKLDVELNFAVNFYDSQNFLHVRQYCTVPSSITTVLQKSFVLTNSEQYNSRQTFQLCI